MRGMLTTGKIQKNNYQDVQCGPSFESKMSSVPLIAPTHAQRIVESEVAFKQEKAVRKTWRSTGKFPFKWNGGWVNFKSLASASLTALCCLTLSYPGF